MQDSCGNGDNQDGYDHPSDFRHEGTVGRFRSRDKPSGQCGDCRCGGVKAERSSGNHSVIEAEQSNGDEKAICNSSQCF